LEDLFEKGHYTWALFVGHLVLEKLLKAYLLCRKYGYASALNSQFVEIGIV